MVPPVQVSPLIKLGRYSALFLGMAYGAKRYSYLKPRAEEERRIAAEEKKKQDERKRIERELAEAQDDSILKNPLVDPQEGPRPLEDQAGELHKAL